MRLYVCAYEQSGMSSEYMYHGVKIVFTKEKAADSFIEKYVYDLYDKTYHSGNK